MRYLRKSISFILIITILFIFSFNSVKADFNLIYETSSKQVITSGVMLEKITRLTEDGWLNINVLRVDFTNPYIKINTMSSSESLNNLVTVQNLAQANGAVAAINGGFFNWLAAGGYPDGPVVQSGDIISAANYFNSGKDTMATIAINNLNQILYNYWKTDMNLAAINGKTTPVVQYNKPSRMNYTDFTVMDRKYGATSVGVSATYPDIVEMVVIEGKVCEIRQSQPAILIPANGYIVVTRQVGGKFLNDNFKVGDPAMLNIVTNPDWSTIEMGVTGSAMLLKDGQIPKTFSLDSPGRHPRTAIGSSQDGKQLIMATVDGRQNGSVGMTLTEAAQLMLQLGAYNALNFDGGGSTTMVAKTLGGTSLNLVNIPSDGGARGVSTAVGIFSIAPPSPLAGLVIDANDSNVFVNTSRKFIIKGYDTYLNPIAIDASQVTWSVSGVEGSFKESTFYPTSFGEGKIKATLGDISAEFDISVLSSPVRMYLSDKSIKLSLGKTKNFTVSGINTNGYSAAIDSVDVNWGVSGNIGSFNQGVFTASGQGTGYIGASIGDTHAYCAVSVATDSMAVKDQFEAANGSYLSSTGGLPGSYEISTEQKYTGKSSGKLTYDFTNTDAGTRAAYMVFSNGGLPLDSNTTKLGLWVYNTHSNPNWLRVEVSDASGKKSLIDFTTTMDWTGWKYVEASLQNVSSIAKLTRIYLVQTSPVSDAGCIYIDDLNITTTSFPVVDLSGVPKDTLPIDEANKSIVYEKSDDSFRFSVLGQSREPGNLLEKLLLSKFADTANNYLEASAFVGNSKHGITQSIKVPFAATNTGNKSFDIKDSRFIQLDISKQSIRTSKTGQWQWFLQQMHTATGNNIFIFMSDSPESFTDPLEKALLKNLLTQYKKSGKNIWVFYKGTENISYMERGIRYISSAGYEVSGLTPANIDSAKYILVTVKGSDVTFEFKPMVN